MGVRTRYGNCTGCSAPSDGNMGQTKRREYITTDLGVIYDLGIYHVALWLCAQSQTHYRYVYFRLYTQYACRHWYIHVLGFLEGTQ